MNYKSASVLISCVQKSGAMSLMDPKKKPILFVGDRGYGVGSRIKSF
jgi:hypothetical protein